MGAAITLAGESLKAQKQGSLGVLDIARFVFANVPGLDPNTEVDRSAGKPPAAQIVHNATIASENKGYVSPNQVVYSVMLGSDIGDWDFNWVGLETAEGVLFAVSYVPLQQKRRNIPPLQIGNNLTRNFLLEFDGALELTGITIDASTWQHDFTVRLQGIDERERLSNLDVYGRACFLGSALQLEKAGSTYQLKPGIAYLEGIRIESKAAVPLTMPALPTTVWVDIALQRQLNDAVATWAVVFGADKTDYTDSAGVPHYCMPIAQVSSAGVITDQRSTVLLDTPLIHELAGKLGKNSNAVSASKLATARTISATGDATGSASFDGSANAAIALTLANSGAVAGTYPKVTINAKGLVTGGAALAAADIPTLNQSTTGNAATATKLATARTISATGDATGSASFDGSANAAIALTLANSGAVAGTYPKVTVNAKGLVTGGAALAAADIPNLDASKITSGTFAAARIPTLNQSTTGNAATATKLATARTISATGDATGSASFDGSANSSIALTLANSGVVAGTYPKVTVNAKGLVTGGAALVAADIPNLDAGKIASGTLAAARIPTLNQNTTGNAATATKLATAITINGVSVNAGSNVNISAAATAASVLSANAGAAVGAVGTYAMLAVGGGGAVSPGSTFPGSSSYYSAADGNRETSIRPAGTWRIMGKVYNTDGSASDSATVCLRIA